MAAGPWITYAPFRLAKGNKEINLSSDTFKFLLLDAGHTPDTDAHDQVSDLSPDEVPATGGYARVTMTSPTWSRTGGTNKFTAGAAPVFTATGASISGVKYAAIIDDSHANKIPVAICDLNVGGGAISDISAGTALQLPVPANGYFQEVDTNG